MVLIKDGVIIMHCNTFLWSDPSCSSSHLWDMGMCSPWSCNKVHIQRQRRSPVGPSTSVPHWDSPGDCSAAAVVGDKGRALD